VVPGLSGVAEADPAALAPQLESNTATNITKIKRVFDRNLKILHKLFARVEPGQ
jgi:hypothetical protein